LHIHCDPQTGWNALHFAAAAHKVKLVQQLLEIGADPAAENAVSGLMPLHLACMGHVRDVKHMIELTKAMASVVGMQVRMHGAQLFMRISVSSDAQSSAVEQRHGSCRC
jgi:ankyrin repeat protein